MASMRGLVGDVAGQHELRADLRCERLDPLLDRIALIGEREPAPWSRQALAMPQAIDRLLATPMMRPRLPDQLPL